MSGGHYEYGQLVLLRDSVEADKADQKHYAGLDDRSKDILREAFHQVLRESGRLSSLIKSLDDYIEGDIGIDGVESALVDWFGYNPFPRPRNGLTIDQAMAWVDSLRLPQKKETPSA